MAKFHGAKIGSRLVTALALASAASLAVTAPAAATPRRHTKMSAGVSYNHRARADNSGYHTLVSDGPGTGFGFHRLPGGYRVAAAAARGRQAAAVRSAVIDDAVESYGYGPFYGGLVGENGFGAGGYGNRGVFSYPDGYGSPYFAGYYGEGTGADYGPFGHAYAN